MSFPRYEKYKDSGVAWLGEVPEHWNTVPFYSVASEREESNKGMIENNLLSLSYGNIIQKDINTNDGLLPESFETYQIIREGDIIFRLTDLQNDKRSLRSAIVKDRQGIITSAYIATAPFGISSKYLNYLLRAYDVVKVFYSMGGGLRQSMKFSDIKRLPILSPTTKEQSDIVNFLDRETTKIDELIAEQQRLIKLLKEKRQAVISHAVTKGLNPDVPMKDSGIEWLGEVPEHWAVCKISYRYEILLGKMLDEKKISGKHLGRYLRNTDVQWDQVNNEELPQMDFHPEEIDRYQVNKGDLLVCEGGEIGRCAIWGFDEPCFYQKALHRVRPYSHKKDYPRFLFYVISDAVNQKRFVSRANKATIAHLPAEVFRQYRFAFPDYEAQVEIAKYLDREKMKFDKLLQEVEESIRLLVERRTALISAAVTGKIKVTGIVE